VLLAAVAEIREALGFDDMVNINEAIRAALHAAEPYLAAAVGTPFTAGSFSDVFYVSEPHTNGALVLTELKLARGFVAEAGFSVVRADAAATLAQGIDVTAAVELDADLGRMVDYRTNYIRQFLKVSYGAGFEADLADPDSYALDQVPAWLQEAAKLKALISLETHPSLEDAGIKQDTRFLQNQLLTILRGRVRYLPSALLPL
jgi:hypothetical protein